MKKWIFIERKIIYSNQHFCIATYHVTVTKFVTNKNLHWWFTVILCMGIKYVNLCPTNLILHRHREKQTVSLMYLCVFMCECPCYITFTLTHSECKWLWTRPVDYTEERMNRNLNLTISWHELTYKISWNCSLYEVNRKIWYNNGLTSIVFIQLSIKGLHYVWLCMLSFSIQVL